ncbi:MAG: RsfS/YbeB/iojap family protein, partial [Spirochaetia bacterium]|nr:RsfS/YbeB/iojap family protein [Spirochaetia bacterium]
EGVHPVHKTRRKEIGNWVVIDYSDIVVHIFRAEIRARYNLEELYKECLRLAV